MWILNTLLSFSLRILPVRVIDYFMHEATFGSESSIKFLGRMNPALFEKVSERKLLYMYQRTSKLVPGYRKFLKEFGLSNSIKNVRKFNELVPQTTKKNYVEKFSISERCIHGKLPDVGYLEESAGSSGKSTNWIRSPEEENNNLPITRIAFHHLYGFENKKPLIVLNGFMLGSWSGGHKFAQRIGAMGICKNIGPDQEKIVESILKFGTGFKFLLGGYPPFITNLVKYGNSITNFSWKDYEIHILTSGEGFVEEWRDYISSQLREGSLIYSDYGATDLDIGVSMETPFTILLRRLIRENKEIRNEILNSDLQPSFIGQYPPGNYYIRNSVNQDGIKEPEISVLNLKSVSPMLKYVVGDEGGIIQLQDVKRILAKYGYSNKRLYNEFNIQTILPFPLIYIYGRTDGTVSINGAMVSPTEVNRAILSEPELISGINRFKLSVDLDEEHFFRLYIFLEAAKNEYVTPLFEKKCNEIINSELIHSNECFRLGFNKHPEKGKSIVHVLPFGSGPFEDEDSLIKQRYLV